MKFKVKFVESVQFLFQSEQVTNTVREQVCAVVQDIERTSRTSS